MNKTFIATALHNASNTFKRFFVTFLYAVVLTVTAIALIETEKRFVELDYQFRNLVIVCLLGISLSLGLTLFAERNKYSKSFKNALQLVGMGLLAGYYLSLPPAWNTIHYFRVSLLAISLHCFVAFSAFIKRGGVEGFWQFNKSLFIRILSSCLYTTVLFIGLILAVVAIESLFAIEMHRNFILELWFFLVGIFNTWFFLSGVPSNLDELDHNKSYPRGLKIFTQFLLLPLVTTYFVILYSYMLKIVVQWQIPNGVVSSMILTFSIFGILSLLLIYPLQNLEAEKWIKIYSRWFYRALLPLVVLLFIAIGMRTSEYGITVSRYYIILLACWLMGISIYLLINRLHNIKVIPISLCLICLLSSFGPWGAFDISKKSQLSRLVFLLQNNEVLINGKIIKPKKDIPSKDQGDLISIIDYLMSMHGPELLMPFLSEDQKQKINVKDKYDFIRGIKSILEINEQDDPSAAMDSSLDSFSYQVEDKLSLSIYVVKGYDYFFENSYFVDEKAPYTKSSVDGHWTLVADAKELKLNYKNESLTLKFDDVYEKLKKLYKLKHHGNVKEEDANFTLEGKFAQIKIVFNDIRGNKNKSTSEVRAKSMHFQCFLKLL